MNTLNTVEGRGCEDRIRVAKCRLGETQLVSFSGLGRLVVGVLLVCLLGAGCRSFSWDWPPWGGLPIPGDEPEPEFPAGIQWIYGSDITDWPVTIELRSAVVHHKSGPVHVVVVDYCDRLSGIPAYYVPGDPDNVHNVNGSIWLLRQFEGQWYAGTIDYLRRGQKLKEFASSRSYKFDPQAGDRVGFMVSTMNRSYPGTIVVGDPNSPYQERSNVVWLEW